MRDLIERLQQEADVLIFDSPPTLAVTDAAVLSRLLDGVLLVVDAGQTRQPMLQRAVGELSKVGAHILGISLNKLSTGRSGYYYYYYYYYYYQDGEGGQRRRRSVNTNGANNSWVSAATQWMHLSPSRSRAKKKEEE